MLHVQAQLLEERAHIHSYSWMCVVCALPVVSVNMCEKRESISHRTLSSCKLILKEILLKAKDGANVVVHYDTVCFLFVIVGCSVCYRAFDGNMNNNRSTAVAFSATLFFTVSFHSHRLLMTCSGDGEYNAVQIPYLTYLLTYNFYIHMEYSSVEVALFTALYSRLLTWPDKYCIMSE